MEQNIEQVLLEHQNLIYSITHYFEGYPNKEDLFQVGVIGLLEAQKRFNGEMGVKFSTYAYPYILGEMRKLVREDKGIKISRDITKLHLKIEKVRILLSQKLMREPSIEEISQTLGIPEYYIAEAERTVGLMQSLDEPICMGGKEMSLHDTVATERRTDLDELITLKEELNQLSPFEKSLIETRYLCNKTQMETAELLGMSQVQVSRKEQKVLTKLRDRIIV